VAPNPAKRLAARPAAPASPPASVAPAFPETAASSFEVPWPAPRSPDRDAVPSVPARPEPTAAPPAAAAPAEIAAPAASRSAPPLSEPRLVAAALARLRAGEDPEGALSLLAEHRRRFPEGALAPEARLAEVEALLALGRRREALRRLDHLTLSRMPRGDALSVVRAELRAGADRCADAIPDFGRCTDEGRCAADVEARALYGRALCHERLGQQAQALVDLRRYLARFPRGRAAESVRRALDAARRER
jgi:TolA-binding protein